VFNGQSTYRVFPVTSLYFPTAHATQGPPSGPVWPLLQVQLLSSALPMRSVCAFVGQVVQACGPSQSLYVFFTQREHDPPSGPVNPATHEQIVIAVSDD
jgi:hypothetical protein